MILITGGTGLLGSHLLLDQIKQGKKVRVITRQKDIPIKLVNLCKFYNIDPGKLESGVEWCEGDITDSTTIADAFEDVDVVYHCAALVSFDSRDYYKLFEINVQGTSNVVNLCLEKGVKKLCYASSTASIGKKANEKVINENGHWFRDQRSTNYSKSKFLAEREVWRGQEEGLNTVIVNPCVILGPGDWDDSSARVFKEARKRIRYYTIGANAFVDVRDVSKIMQKLVEEDVQSERFLLIGENLSFLDLFSILNAGFGHPKPDKLAKKWQTSLAWRFEKLRTIFGGNRRITKEMAVNSHATVVYSNQKIKSQIDFDFFSIKETVDFCMPFYKNYFG